tara:strand:- start:1366 stop:1632 length:267 start_codon:yes stop_codon:yes gene_type:complete
MGDGNVTVCVTAVSRETEKAFLLVFEGGEEHWMPKSQIRSDLQTLKAGEFPVGIQISSWIAEEKFGDPNVPPDGAPAPTLNSGDGIPF